MVPARVTDPPYQGEIGLLLHSGGKEERVCCTNEILGCPVVKVNRELATQSRQD